MITSFEEFIRLSHPYVQLCEQFLTEHGLSEEVIVDHICFKCKSAAEYNRLRIIFETDPPSLYLYQVFLARRRIAYLRLRDGIRIHGGSINFIELADKKPVKEDMLGFHHVEIYPQHMTYKGLLKKLKAQGVNLVLKERPHHTTHDIFSSSGFIIRLTDKPLIQKIIREQM